MRWGGVEWSGGRNKGSNCGVMGLSPQGVCLMLLSAGAMEKKHVP